MSKMSASFGLASRRGSTCRKGTPPPITSLRPRWTDFLTILLALYLLTPAHPALCMNGASKWLATSNDKPNEERMPAAGMSIWI